mmetsp:Transcript_100644/g.300284  ORF Transcript_100644/g.300284 Transcript_100644/m.300284 type:complete len:290 (-) Transcript_100644:147-1016(-)
MTGESGRRSDVSSFKTTMRVASKGSRRSALSGRSSSSAGLRVRLRPSGARTGASGRPRHAGRLAPANAIRRLRKWRMGAAPPPAAWPSGPARREPPRCPSRSSCTRPPARGALGQAPPAADRRRRGQSGGAEPSSGAAQCSSSSSRPSPAASGRGAHDLQGLCSRRATKRTTLVDLERGISRPSQAGDPRLRGCSSRGRLAPKSCRRRLPGHRRSPGAPPAISRCARIRGRQRTARATTGSSTPPKWRNCSSGRVRLRARWFDLLPPDEEQAVPAGGRAGAREQCARRR